MILSLTLGLLAAQQIQLPQSMDLALQDFVPAQQLTHGGAGRATSACDDFNRANGPVGPDWTQVIGVNEVISNAVSNLGGSHGWMRHNTAALPYASAEMELDVLANPLGLSRLSALIVGENAGTGDSIYVKVQNQTGSAGYSHYAFYRNYGGGSGGGWGGFFAFGFQMDAAGDGMHIRVRHIADVTYLEIDDDLDTVYEYSFNSVGTAGASGYIFGTGCGYGSWGSGTADNWELNGGCGGPPSFTLAKSGTCPGLMSLSTSNGTANRPVAILYGNAGSWTKPGGACAGTTLGISSPTLRVMLGASSSGAASVSFSTAPAFCGRTVQAVDVGSCTASNTVVL